MRMESTFGEAGGDRMEKLYRILKIFLWCAIGIFVGQSIYQCYDYYARPGLYASNSAPWYTSILLSGVVTLIIVLLMLLVMWMIQKKLSKKWVWRKICLPIIKQPKRKNALSRNGNIPVNMRFIIPYRMRNRKKEALGLPILRTIFTLFMMKQSWSVL